MKPSSLAVSEQPREKKRKTGDVSRFPLFSSSGADTTVYTLNNPPSVLLNNICIHVTSVPAQIGAVFNVPSS
jgi:hypothetical protein